MKRKDEAVAIHRRERPATALTRAVGGIGGAAPAPVVRSGTACEIPAPATLL